MQFIKNGLIQCLLSFLVVAQLKHYTLEKVSMVEQVCLGARFPKLVLHLGKSELETTLHLFSIHESWIHATVVHHHCHPQVFIHSTHAPKLCHHVTTKVRLGLVLVVQLERLRTGQTRGKVSGRDEFHLSNLLSEVLLLCENMLF